MNATSYSADLSGLVIHAVALALATVALTFFPLALKRVG